MRGIYVERRVRGSVDEVWRLTQTPEVHQRWDLRFTETRYLPRNEGEPQRFLYATRWMPGIAVAGTGESVGERVGADGNASSALKFASGNWWSLIREGSGYWKYVPVADGVRFLTWYDYEVRFGRWGRAVDAAAFKPLIGWATAWSFDRLALWLEDGQTPEISMIGGGSVCGGKGATTNMASVETHRETALFIPCFATSWYPCENQKIILQEICKSVWAFWHF